MAGDLPRAERETTLAFNNAETKAEVTTCRHDWMRQLERYGAVPETIQVFEHGDGEHRLINVNYSCRPTTITFASSPPVGSCQLRSADGLGLH